MPEQFQFEYAPRPVRFLDFWELEGIRFKAYTISYSNPKPPESMIASARNTIAEHLKNNPTEQRHYGVGFLGVHEGCGENQIILDLWINQNEILHAVYVSPTDNPDNWQLPPQDHNSVCVWDLYLQSYEREAWLKHVLNNSEGADFEGYFADHADADV